MLQNLADDKRMQQRLIIPNLGIKMVPIEPPAPTLTAVRIGTKNCNKRNMPKSPTKTTNGPRQTRLPDIGGTIAAGSVCAPFQEE